MTCAWTPAIDPSDRVYSTLTHRLLVEGRKLSSGYELLITNLLL
jgi:hypothetical protein